MQIELQFLFSFLNHTELRVTLRDVGCTFVCSAQFSGFYIEADGQFLAGEFNVVAAIHFHPFIVAVQAKRTLLHFSIAHQVGGCLIR